MYCPNKVRTPPVTSTSNVASGYVGEVVSGTLAADSSFTSETLTDLASTSLPLTAGIWEVTLIVPCLLSLSALTGGTRISQVLQITRSDNTVIAATGVNAVETGQSPLRRITEVTLTGTIRLTGNDTLKLRGRLGKWSGTESYTASESIIYTGFGYQFYAKRIG